MSDKKKKLDRLAVSDERKARVQKMFNASKGKIRSEARKKTIKEQGEVKEQLGELRLEAVSKSLDEKLNAGNYNLTPDERKLAKARLELINKERDKRLRDNNLVKFCPNGAQKAIGDLVGNAGTDIREPQIVGWFAGNGIGKTALLINLIGNIVFGPQPFIATPGSLDDYIDEHSEINWVPEWGEPPEYWFRYPIFSKWPYPKALRIISTPANLNDNGAIQLEIDKWWPKHLFQGIKGKYDYRSEIKTNMGFTLELKTYDQDRKEHESKTLGGIFADEPIPQHLWGPTVSRLRRGGLLFCGMTALFESAFLYDEIIEKSETDPTVKFMYGDVEENCVEHGTRGILTHQAIIWLLDKYPPEERESRKSGQLLSLIGKVHKDFERKIHVIGREGKEGIPSRDFILANKHLFQFYQVVDPHDRKWDAIGYYALDDNNRKYCIDEYPDRSLDPYHRLVDRRYDFEQLIKQVLKPKEAAMGFLPGDITRIMDPRYAHNRSQRGAQKTGLTIEEEWSLHYNEGFISNITDDFKVGKNKLDNSLMIGKDGIPYLVFFNGYADNHIYALEHWMWDRWEGKTAEKRDVKEEPQKKNSDYPRLLHYLCTFDPTFTRRTPKLLGWREKLKNNNKNKRGAETWMGM